MKASFCLQAGRSLLRTAGRGLPGERWLMGAYTGVLVNAAGRDSPRRATYFSLLRQRNLRKRKATRSLGPYASLQATCAAQLRRGSAELAFGSNSCGPDPASICAARPSQDGWGAGTHTEYLKKQGHALACPCLSWSWSSLPWGSVFALRTSPSWLGRGAQRQADQGSRLSEPKASSSETPLASSTAGCPKRSAGTQTAGRLFFGDFLLAKQKKVTGRRATPGQQPSTAHPIVETSQGFDPFVFTQDRHLNPNGEGRSA